MDGGVSNDLDWMMGMSGNEDEESNNDDKNDDKEAFTEVYHERELNIRRQRMFKVGYRTGILEDEDERRRDATLGSDTSTAFSSHAQMQHNNDNNNNEEEEEEVMVNENEDNQMSRRLQMAFNKSFSAGAAKAFCISFRKEFLLTLAVYGLNYVADLSGRGVDVEKTSIDRRLANMKLGEDEMATPMRSSKRLEAVRHELEELYSDTQRAEFIAQRVLSMVDLRQENATVCLKETLLREVLEEVRSLGK